jgi:uncharacterized protein with HEPN domain
MLPESSKLLLDIRQALDDIADFTRGLDLEAYSRDAKCRAAVERKFGVMGEACTRLRDRFPEVFEKMPDARQMISFRNRLIHGYDSVDDYISGYDLAKFEDD